MPKSITLYNVFVASPSDVKEERDSLEDVIREINLTTAENLGVRLDLIRWESHTFPDFGEDAQDVINKQINDDFDIFIGIMWSRFGTPTARSQSGTKEEFQRALAKWKQSEKKIKLMFYFKNAPILPENIDIEQIQFLREFKKELGEKGALYWQYNDTDEFKKLLRIHINKSLSNLINLNSSINNNSNLYKEQTLQINSSLTSHGNFEEIEELGLFECIELMENKFSECWVVIDKITTYLNELTLKNNESTNLLTRLINAPENVKVRERKRVIENSSEDLKNFAQRVKIEIPIFKKLFESGFNAFASAYSISKSFSSNQEEMENLKQSIIKLKEGLISGISGNIAFRDSIQSLPNMTTSLGKSKKLTLEVLTDLVKEFEFALQLTSEFETEEINNS